jgi:hypothetical protein
MPMKKRDHSNRKKIEQWLRGQPRVTVSADLILEALNFIGSLDAERLIDHYLEVAEQWLGTHPGVEIEDKNAWNACIYDGNL